MDTSDRETLRMAVHRLNRLEDKVDDHMAAESDPGVTLEAVPGPRFIQLGDHIINLDCIVHVAIVRPGNEKGAAPSIVLDMVGDLEITIEPEHEEALLAWLDPAYLGAAREVEDGE